MTTRISTFLEPGTPATGGARCWCSGDGESGPAAHRRQNGKYAPKSPAPARRQDPHLPGARTNARPLGTLTGAHRGRGPGGRRLVLPHHQLEQRQRHPLVPGAHQDHLPAAPWRVSPCVMVLSPKTVTVPTSWPEHGRLHRLPGVPGARRSELAELGYETGPAARWRHRVRMETVEELKPGRNLGIRARQRE